MDNKYSYSLYDALGRIVEVGQKPQTTLMTQAICQNEVELNQWITTLINGGGLREQITYTGYDAPFGESPLYPNGIFFGLGLDQRNMRNRVTYTGTRNLENDCTAASFFYAGTFYTYDIHGNVDTLLQDYSGLGIAGLQATKRIVYNYDLISGNVRMVSYQPDWYSSEQHQWVINADKFYYKYKYDVENRLTEAYTSRDKIVWERDAEYNYYKHGPLSRTVIGQQQVQGVDYVNNIQGWLKGVNGTNSSNSNGVFDIGGDGLIGGVNSNVARDIYGFGLHYFDNGATEIDYKAIGATSFFARPNNAAFVSIYNETLVR